MPGEADISVDLAIEIKEFLAGIQQAQASAQKFSKAGAQSGGGWASAFKSIGKNIAGFVSMAVKAAATVGAAFAGLAAFLAANLFKNSTASAADFEQLSISMATFVGGSEKAKQILDEISAFSVVTPFETQGLQEATNQLLSAGIAADSVVDILKETAAVAKDTAQVGELAEALAKGFAKGKFQTEELNKFLERGINLMPTLEAVTGKTGSALTKAIEKGLKFDEVREAIARMSQEGGLFFGMLEKQSTTSKGLVSTLSSNVEEFQRIFGEPINDAIKPILEGAIKATQDLTKYAGYLGQAFAGWLTEAIVMIRAAVQLISSIGFEGMAELFGAALMLAVKNSINFFYKGFAAGVAGVITYFIEGAKNVAALFQIITTGQFWAGLGKVLLGIAQAFGAAMLRHLSNLIAAIKSKVALAEKIFGDAEATLLARAETMIENGRENREGGAQDLVPAFAAAHARMAATLGNVAKSFSTTFDKSMDILDTTKEAAQIADASAALMHAAADIRQGMKKTVAKPGEGSEGGASAREKDMSLPVINSRLAGAINTITGRSAQAVIAAAAAKTSENTARTAKATEEIAKKIGGESKPRPKPGQRAPGGGRFV